MIVSHPLPLADRIIYPESDGKPMAENTRQLQWIVMLYGNLAALYREEPNVFVGGNQLWYPVEGHPEVQAAPDVYVVFGRPKGHRGSYKQWEEGNLPLTVVFEVLSPSNDAFEMADKLAFYDEYGVEEYYVYDPETNRLLVYLRQGAVLRRIWKADGHVSPRLGIRFDLSGPVMVVYYPEGRRFLTFEEMEAERRAAEHRAEQERQRAEQERLQRLELERQLTRLVELSRKVRGGEATAAELAELERTQRELGDRCVRTSANPPPPEWSPEKAQQKPKE